MISNLKQEMRKAAYLASGALVRSEQPAGTDNGFISLYITVVSAHP